MDASARELTRFNVISSRIRLARNVVGMPFPSARRREDPKVLAVLASAAADAARGLMDFQLLYMRELDDIRKNALVERHLISPMLARNTANGAVVLERSENISVMLNEEDRIREQCIVRGFDLEGAYARLSGYDAALAERLPPAFDRELGYLTACPTNLGTGMRASVMLHLPGLVLSGQIGPTIQGVNKLNLAVRGIAGEGTDNRGNLFQVSNQSTLGESEPQIIERLNHVISQLIAHEKSARQLLLQRDQFALLDHVGRAYGTLRHCYRLSSEEALNSLSLIRFGVDLGMFTNVNVHIVNELFIAIGAAHLQHAAGHELSAAERDVARAALCRERLRQAG